jgi:uncharacterized protein YecE (DUF72 family)
MDKLNIVIVEDDKQAVKDLAAFLRNQQELPCTVDVVERDWYDFSLAEVIEEVKKKSEGNSVVLLDNELGRYTIGERIAAQLGGVKIISLSSIPNCYVPLRFLGKNSITLVRTQQDLISMIQKVVAS